MNAWRVLSLDSEVIGFLNDSQPAVAGFSDVQRRLRKPADIGLENGILTEFGSSLKPERSGVTIRRPEFRRNCCDATAFCSVCLSDLNPL